MDDVLCAVGRGHDVIHFSSLRIRFDLGDVLGGICLIHLDIEGQLFTFLDSRSMWIFRFVVGQI